MKLLLIINIWWLINEKYRKGTHCTKMGADKSAENISNAPKIICPNCRPKTKSLEFWWKKASLSACSSLGVHACTNLTIQAVLIYTIYLVSILWIGIFFKNCSSDGENFSLWSSLDEFIQIMKDQNNLLNRIPFTRGKYRYSNFIATNTCAFFQVFNKCRKQARKGFWPLSAV